MHFLPASTITPSFLHTQTAQGPPPPYPNNQQQQSQNGSLLPNKRFKSAEEAAAAAAAAAQQHQQQNGGQRVAQPSFYLNTNQMQMLQSLQQHQANLNPQQQQALQQLTQQYRLMQQHQHQMRMQQQQQQQQRVHQQQQQQIGGRPPSQQQPYPPSAQQQQPGYNNTNSQQTTPRVPQTGTVAQTGFADNGGQYPAATGHSLPNAGMPYKSAAGFQPQPTNGFTQITSTTNASQQQQQHQSDMDQELQALLSQKDMATSFAENLLKQFGGSDALCDGIKEELPDEAGVGSASPPQNVAADSTTSSLTPVKCEATSTSLKQKQLLQQQKQPSSIPASDTSKPEPPVLKIEKLFGDDEPLGFNTDMDSKQILETVR